ncbi:hypothetical protein JB92DRAFT_293006 [Gautieria morchelliformis]|nr:hypothetical protein JB92DRAFT_293006 [Gautieria morchelliformis]
MAGCSWCQPNVYSTNWVTESQWRSGCSNYDASGNLPSQASSLQSTIPPWALMVENGQTWLDFEASSIAVAGSTPTATLTAPNGFNTATGFNTQTSLGPLQTGPFSGGSDDSNTNVVLNNSGKVVGIAVGVTLGCYLIFYGIALAVFLRRQKNRKAWYGPTAEFYRNGGRMGDIHAGQPLLGGSAPSFATPSSPGSTSYPTSAYQPGPPPLNQYDPNPNGYPSAPSQHQQPPTGLYDPSTNYGYPQYQDNLQTGVPPTSSAPQTIQV